MKFVLVVIGLAVGVAAYEPIITAYHEEVGIPEAARTKRAEEAIDFDGSRIVGGNLVGAGTHPHLGGLIVTLTTNQQSICGSSLLSNNRALTAAHCWRSRTNSGGTSQGRSVVVVFGSANLWSGGTRVTSTNVQLHANYNMNNLNNDIAMIIIPWVNFNNNVNRVIIATGSNSYAGTWAVAAGYGRIADNNAGNQAKRDVSIQVITNAVCASTYGSSVVNGAVICTSTAGGRGVCSGDSGGPLTAGTGGARRLIGVTCFVHAQGCQRGFPAGFVRVTSFTSWINARL